MRLLSGLLNSVGCTTWLDNHLDLRVFFIQWPVANVLVVFSSHRRCSFELSIMETLQSLGLLHGHCLLSLTVHRCIFNVACLFH